MEATKSAWIKDHFAELTDPRRRMATYPLINVVVMEICGIIGGVGDFVAIAHWARAHKDWLSKYLDLSSGIPSLCRPAAADPRRRGWT